MAIAQMRSAPIPTRSSSLRRVLSGGTWLVNHTKPPYIQKSTVRISAVRIVASTETPCSSSDVSWVSVKTKTRSKNSSRFETPRSMGSGATLRDARAWGGVTVEKKNLDIYGHGPIPWSRALKQLAANSGTYWLATTRRDGRPHLAAVGALWVDENVYFTSGPRTRKSRDIATNPRCVVSISLKDLDVVIEGTARNGTDDATLKPLPKL